MGTRANIGIVEGDKVRYIYTHWDGYPFYMGMTLLQYYNKKELAKAIVDGGNLSSLGMSVDKKDTVFYHRDGGELWADEKPQIVPIPLDWNKLKKHDYLYVWKDGAWHWIDENNIFRLLTAEDCLTSAEKKNKPLTETKKPDNVTSMKYKTIGFRTVNEGNSEVAQYIAFGLGYKWSSGETGQVQNQNASILVFYPDNKTIKFSFNAFIADKEVKTLIELKDALKNPELCGDVVEIGDVKYSIQGNGDVEIDLPCTLKNVLVDSDVLDSVIKARNKVLGVEEKVLPVVKFMYRSQSDYYDRLRKVQLMSLDKDYLTGLDMEEGNKYKKYSVKSIKGDVAVVSFGKSS